jgi:hypothetical protein
VNRSGARDSNAILLRREHVLDHDTAVVQELGGPGEIVSWRATDFHCLPVRVEARSGSEVLSRRDLVAIHSKPSHLFKIPRSFERVDLLEYARRKHAYRGLDPEKVEALAGEEASSMGEYVPGFQISSQFLE